MRFDNTPTSDGGSYEQPKPGKYLGVLVGFAYVGTHAGGQYGPKKKIMLRWELHKRKGPVLDSKGFVLTTQQTFGATVKGENSLLRKALEAHGVVVPEGGNTDSHEWLGKAAWLDMEESTGSNNKQYCNVKTISRLDPEEDPIPAQVIQSEHWEPDDGTPAPSWANWAVLKSTDLSHLGVKRTPQANGTPAGAMAGVGAGSDEGDEDIPF